MGVLKKSFIHTLVFSLVLGSTSVYADGDTPSAIAQSAPAPAAKKAPQTPKFDPSKSTEFAAFKPESFCSRAPDMLSKLNKENESKAQELDSLKTQIDEANSYMGIINGVDTLKRQYQAGLNEIAKTKTPQSIAAQKADKYKTLDNMKQVIRNGLIINAIGLVFKDSKLDSDEAFKVASLCKKEKADSQPVCSLKQSNVVLDVLKGHPLDPILDNFRLAYRNIQKNNQDNLRADVQKIIDSIPPTIAPSAILSMLEQASPGLTDIMASDESMKVLTKCLSGKSDEESLPACEKLLPEVGKENNFMEQLNQQTNQAVAGIQGFSKIIDESTRANLADFNKEMTTYTSQVKATDMQQAQIFRQMHSEAAKTLKGLAETSALRQAALRSSVQDQKVVLAPRQRQIAVAELESSKLDGIQNLFFNADLKHVQQAGQVPEQNSAAMKAAIERARLWKEKCDDSATLDLKYCQGEMDAVSSNLNEMKTNYKSKLEFLRGEFGRIKSEGNDRFRKVETLKKFVAEKYLRACTKTTQVKTKKEEIRLGIAVDGKCFSGVHTLNTLEGLGSEVNDIIVNTKFALSIDAQSDSTGIFTKDEMTNFTGVCQAEEYRKSFSDVCQEVSGEKIERDKVKDSKEWEAFNEKYWVSYDASSPKGYSVAKRKSNLRVFGEGVLPVVPQMLPMVFGNYMMRQNIDTLTNQALYQKQMLHNYDVYNSNPWMYNYNYFGSSTFPGIATTTTTGVTNTSGFGF